MSQVQPAVLTRNINISAFTTHQVPQAQAEVVLSSVNHDSPPSYVSLPSVSESDAAVHLGDEGEGGALQCEDVAQVPGVSVEGPGTGVVLLVWVEVTPSRLAVVPGVSSLVNMEPVLSGAQS